MNQHRTSFLLEIHSFDNFQTMKRIIPSISTIKNNTSKNVPIKELALKLLGKTINENILHRILAIIAFFREIPNQYFIMMDSNTATNNSHIITYNVQFHSNKGRTNHNNGSVIVVGIIHQQRSFLLDI